MIGASPKQRRSSSKVDAIEKKEKENEHPLLDPGILNARTESELTQSLFNWYKKKGHIEAPNASAKKIVNKCVTKTVQPRIPTLPQALAHCIFKLPANSSSVSRRGLLCWHSLGSGKTTTATGVMGAFWPSDRQIVYASSIGGIESNPIENFEAASKMFPGFEWNEKRDNGLLFLSFAKLANKIIKGEKLKSLFSKEKEKGSVKMTKMSNRKGMRGGDDGIFTTAKESLSPVLPPAPPSSPELIAEIKTPSPVEPTVEEKTKKTSDKNEKEKKKVVEEEDVDEFYDSENEFEEEEKEVENKKKKDTKPEKTVKPTNKKSKDPFEDVFAKKTKDGRDEDDDVDKEIDIDDIEIDEDDNEDDILHEVDGDGEEKEKEKEKEKKKGKKEEKEIKKITKKAIKSSNKEKEQEKEPYKKIKENKEKIEEVDVNPRKLKQAPFYEILASRYGVLISLAMSACAECNIKSFNDFVDLDKTILIIDEVHNLFRPLPMHKQKHKYVEQHLIDPLMHPQCKIVVLTATPGSTTSQVVTLLNMVSSNGPVGPAPNPDSAEDVAAFKQKIKSVVSYFDLTNDAGLFPSVSDPGPLKWPMSMPQFLKYADAYNEVAKKNRDYDELAAQDSLPKFWSKARKYANMMYQFDKSLQLSEFSSKMPALLDTIAKYPDEKHYVYSAFYDKRGSGQGILEIARQLENYGYSRYGGKAVEGGAKSTKSSSTKSKTPTKAKHLKYVLAIQGQPGLASAVKAFNDSSNVDGSNIHVFLATQNFNEGLDLKAVRHVHIFEPLVTMASDQQTIGRARRFCSHADLNRKDWTVKIHRYFSEMPIEISSEGGIDGKLKHLMSLKTDLMNKKQVSELNKEIKLFDKLKKMELKSIDQFIYDESQRRVRDLFTIYRCMQEASIDCIALSQFHGFDKKGDFKCI